MLQWYNIILFVTDPPFSRLKVKTTTVTHSFIKILGTRLVDSKE